MKKLYILILLSFCSFFGKSQYTLTAASLPIVGDVDLYKDLDSTGLFFGSSGTSQTWNYTAIGSLTNTPASNTFVAMSSVPNNFLFPTGTIATDDGAGNFGVLSNNSTKYEHLGYATATASNCWSYSDPLKLYDLPFTYGTVSTDIFKIIQPTFTATGTFTTTGDGTGTLQLPTGNFSNVLKLNYVLYEIDTNLTSIQTYTLLLNQYFSAASKFPLLEVQTITTTVNTGSNSTSYYYKYGRIIWYGTSSGITEEKSVKDDFTVYPNPVSDGELFISNNTAISRNISIEIINVLGQSIKTISFENKNGMEPKKINVNDLAKGIYYLKSIGKQGIKTQKIIIE